MVQFMLNIKVSTINNENLVNYLVDRRYTMNIFISHSSKDKKYGDALVQLLQDIGISPNDIIFTSNSGYGIPKGQNIFKWLKNRLKEKSFIIYLLSDNYYSSIACLNEMGAAWIIENDHLVMFASGFNPSNKKFFEGAIDPREMGVFMDNKQDIIDFVEIITDKLDIKTRQVVVHQAISKYMKSIDNIIGNITEEKHVVDSEYTKISKGIGNTNGDDVILEQKEIVDLISLDNSTSTTFFDDILKGKLSDEELLLIKYMNDTGKITLGDRWMASQEIENISNWEDIKTLNSKLSNSYKMALRKLKIRKYVKVHKETEYGNPKEYILIDDISDHILDFPNNILKILDDTMNKHVKLKKYPSTNDIPF